MEYSGVLGEVELIEGSRGGKGETKEEEEKEERKRKGRTGYADALASCEGDGGGAVVSPTSPPAAECAHGAARVVRLILASHAGRLLNGVTSQRGSQASSFALAYWLTRCTPAAIFARVLRSRHHRDLHEKEREIRITVMLQRRC